MIHGEGERDNPQNVLRASSPTSKSSVGASRCCYHQDNDCLWPTLCLGDCAVHLFGRAPFQPPGITPRLATCCPALLPLSMTDWWGTWWILTLALAPRGALDCEALKARLLPMFASSQPSSPQPAALPSLPSGCGSTASKAWASVCCGRISSSRRSAHSFNPSHSWPHAAPQGLAAAQPYPASSVSSCGLHPFISRIIFSFLTCQGLCLQNWNGACKTGL